MITCAFDTPGTVITIGLGMPISLTLATLRYVSLGSWWFEPHLNRSRQLVRGSARGRHLGVESVRAFEMALDRFLTHASIATPLERSGFDGSTDSRLTWNLVQSVLLRSRRSGGLRKNDRHCVSISMGK